MPGVLPMVGCAGYPLSSVGPPLLPGYGQLPLRSLISIPGSIGEIGTCLWLVLKGAREVPHSAAAHVFRGSTAT